MCRKRLCFWLLFMCRRIAEYISLELFDGASVNCLQLRCHRSPHGLIRNDNCFNPFTAMLAAPSPWKWPTKVPDLKSVRPFPRFTWAREWIAIQTHITESRVVTGPSKSTVCRRVCVCALFSPDFFCFAGWGSEGVNDVTPHVQLTRRRDLSDGPRLPVRMRRRDTPIFRPSVLPNCSESPPFGEFSLMEGARLMARLQPLVYHILPPTTAIMDIFIIMFPPKKTSSFKRTLIY